jgi:hypothetical protein
VTPEELDRLVDDITGQLEGLVDDPEKPLGRKERRRRVLLLAKKEALERLKAAREHGDLNKETRASLDYSLLTEYGEKHPLLFNIIRSQLGWWAWW